MISTSQDMATTCIARLLVNASRILIVADKPSLRRLLHASLFAEGFEVSEASNGEEAIALFASSSTMAFCLTPTCQEKAESKPALICSFITLWLMPGRQSLTHSCFMPFGELNSWLKWST